MTILVTRPSPAGEQLVTRLRALGRVAYHAPLIDFSPRKRSAQTAGITARYAGGRLGFCFITERGPLR